MVLLALVLGLLLLFLPESSGAPERDGEAALERQAQEKPPPSKIASPGFYPASYKIDAEYAESPRVISGTQSMRYVNAEGRPLESLRFNLWTNEKVFTERGGGTDVSEVSVNGRQAFFDVEGTGLEVELPSPLPDGQGAKVELEFETRIPEIAAPFGHNSGVSALGVWYPVLAVHDKNGWNRNPATDFGEPYFSEAADYRVNLTLPEHLTSVATGTEEDRSASGGKKTITYEADSVRDFALAVSEEFTRLSRNVNGTRVNVYHLPSSEFRAERALDMASRSLRRFSNLYGAYPYDELDVVDAPLRTGMEYSALVFTGMSNTSDSLFQTVVPHEVAHQWWYVQVGSNQFEEPWLDESLATYSEWLFTGDAATRFPQPVQPEVPLGSPVNASPDQAAYEESTYLYGAQLYRDLSRKIGEKTLIRGLRSYVSQNRYGISTEEDLVRTLSKAAGQDLAPFFIARGVTLENNEDY